MRERYQSIRLLATLFRERADILDRIASEIPRVDPTRILDVFTRYQPTAKREQPPLRFLVWKLLLASPLTMDQLVRGVRDANYRSKASTEDGFRNCVQQAIGYCRRVKLVVRDRENKAYVAEAVKEHEAWRRLGCRSRPPGHPAPTGNRKRP